VNHITVVSTITESISVHHKNVSDLNESRQGAGIHTSTAAARKPLATRALDKMILLGISTRTDKTFLTFDSEAEQVPLSRCFPISSEQESYILRTGKHATTIQTIHGVVMATLEPSHPDQRLLKDSDGRVCAMILRSQDMDGTNSFTICGLKPAVKRQKMTHDTFGQGYLKWAEVRNLGGLGGQFALKHTRDDTSSNSTFVTKSFGSLCRPKKTRGHVVRNQKQTECAKIVSLKKGKGVLVAPKEDPGLMLCYAAIVDEMIEHRMR
jgi:hypothetical protein